MQRAAASTRLSLRGGRNYLLEYGPSTRSYVRTTIRRLDSPAAAIKLGPVQTVAAGNGSSYVTAGDLNGDGALDLVDSVGDDASGLNFLQIFRGDGAGRVTFVSQYATSVPADNVIGDFTGDSIPDVVAATSTTIVAPIS